MGSIHFCSKFHGQIIAVRTFHSEQEMLICYSWRKSQGFTKDSSHRNQRMSVTNFSSGRYGYITAWVKLWTAVGHREKVRRLHPPLILTICAKFHSHSINFHISIFNINQIKTVKSHNSARRHHRHHLLVALNTCTKLITACPVLLVDTGITGNLATL